MSFFTAPWMLIARFWRVLLSTTLSDLKTTHAGSVAGLLWIVISPLLLMAIYSVIYLLIFRVRPLDMESDTYVLYIFSGLIPFLGFSTALMAGTTTLSANKDILVNTVFPAELVPARTVFSNFIPSLIGLVMVVFLALWLGHVNPLMLLIPVVLLLLVMFVCGVVWLLSLLNLVVRDIQYALTFVNMALLVVSPIAYTESMVPSSLKMVIYFNPLSYFIIPLHDLIVFERVPSAGVMGGAIALGLLSFSLGFYIFQKAKKVFFDYV